MQSQEQYRNEILLKAKRWRGLYPQYFDKTLSINEGRKIPQQIAVPNPTIQEIAVAIKKLKLHAIIEPNKCYSRNWMVKGRIKVQLVDDDGKILNDEIKKNKKLLMRRIAQLINETPERQEKPEGKPLHGTKEYSLALDFLNKTSINDDPQQSDAPQTKKEQKKNKRRGK